MTKHDYSLIKYGISAGISFAFDFVVFAASCRILETAAPFAYIIYATIIARVLSSCLNFTLNHRLVFRSRKSIKVTFTKYAALVIIQMSMSALLVTAAHNLLNFDELVAKIIIDTCIFFVNYIIQRMHIF